MRILTLALSALLLLGCGEAGPTQAELDAAKVQKDCGKLYSGMSKVVTDLVRKQGVKANLGDKEGFVKICAKAGLSDEQLKCLDPNLGGTEECKKALEGVKEQTKELHEHLMAPMTKKPAPKAEEGAEKPADAPK